MASVSAKGSATPAATPLAGQIAPKRQALSERWLAGWLGCVQGRLAEDAVRRANNLPDHLLFPAHCGRCGLRLGTGWRPLASDCGRAQSHGLLSDGAEWSITLTGLETNLQASDFFL